MAKKFQVNTASGGSLTTNLVGYYKLDESSGNRADFYSTNNLTDVNTVAQDASGIVNQAAIFNRAAEEELEASADTVYDGFGDFSISCWLKTTSADNGMVCSKYNSAVGDGIYIGINGDAANKASFSISSALGTEYVVVRNTTNINGGAWQHIVVTRTGNTVKIYYNTSDETTAVSSAGTVDANISVSAINFKIGGAIVAAHNLTGSVDEMGIWTKVLSTNEITDLYNGGAGNTMISTDESGFLNFMGPQPQQ